MSEQNQNPYQQTPQSNPYQQTPPANPYSAGNPEEKTNTLSIVGLILAFLVNIAGFIVSIIALKQIKETGEKGRGLAIAGIIVSIISMILGIVVAFFIVTAGILTTSASGTKEEPFSSSTIEMSASPSATSSTSTSASASPTPSPSASTQSMGEAWPSAGDVSSPDTPYCQAMADFVTKVTSPDDASAPSSEEVLASLITLRDNTTDEYTKEKLTLAIEAVYSNDEQAFEDELTAALLTITFDAEKCGVEF